MFTTSHTKTFRTRRLQDDGRTVRYNRPSRQRQLFAALREQTAAVAR